MRCTLLSRVRESYSYFPVARSAGGGIYHEDGLAPLSSRHVFVIQGRTTGPRRALAATSTSPPLPPSLLIAVKVAITGHVFHDPFWISAALVLMMTSLLASTCPRRRMHSPPIWLASVAEWRPCNSNNVKEPSAIYILYVRHIIADILRVVSGRLLSLRSFCAQYHREVKDEPKSSSTSSYAEMRRALDNQSTYAIQPTLLLLLPTIFGLQN